MSAQPWPAIQRILLLAALTLDLCVVSLGVAHEECCGLAVEGVGGVGVPQELGHEDLENVDHVKHRRPGLVDHVETDRARELVNVGWWVSGGVSQARDGLVQLDCLR